MTDPSWNRVKRGSRSGPRSSARRARRVCRARRAATTPVASGGAVAPCCYRTSRPLYRDRASSSRIRRLAICALILYQVLEFLGAGGMGEVYRARDGKLNRDVALKVRSRAFAPDSDRLARFRREAHVLASLNHANIAAIYGFAGGRRRPGARAGARRRTDAGQPHIRQRPFLSGEALSIAKQIAEGLKAAHERASFIAI